MNQNRVLIFHPEQSIRQDVQAKIIALNIDVECVASLEHCIETMQSNKWDIIFIPASLGSNGNATDVIEQLSVNNCRTPIVILSKTGQHCLVNSGLRAGALDYLQVPFSVHHIEQIFKRVSIAKNSLKEVVAHSDISVELFKMAHFAAQADISVLITGESGTGKEVVAQYIHQNSLRASAPFVAINCAAIPETMVESILFGHTKGAFTGAINANPGKLELANQGTLFLDEIGELPLSLQAKLLRVLQEREVERLGSHQKTKLDIRVIAATNQNLDSLIAQGKFREDLFYRLNVFPLMCSPLRERKEDILPLAYHLLRTHQPNVEHMFTKSAEKSLLSYGWPGNVRELDNVIQRALVMVRGCEIDTDKLMLPVPNSSKIIMERVKTVRSSLPVNEKPRLQESRKQAEFEMIIATLKRFDGHRNKTAQELGLSSRALRHKIQMMREQGVDIELLLASTAEPLVMNNHLEN